MVEAISTGGKSQRGSNRAPYDNYKELLEDSLNKIIKTVNKSKNKELIALCQKALGKSTILEFYLFVIAPCWHVIWSSYDDKLVVYWICLLCVEQVAADQNDDKLSANKYFYIFKMAIESKLPRLVEQLLYRVQKLFSYDFLDGNCPDNCKYEEG